LKTALRKKWHQDYYNNASEVIRDALRFWETNEQLVQHMKLEALKVRLAIGADQAQRGAFVGQSVSEVIAETRDAEIPPFGVQTKGK